MRRHEHYPDSHMNSMYAAQMQQMPAQRSQQISDVDNFTGKPDSFRPVDDYQYASSKQEGKWQWDRDVPRGSNQLSPQTYREGSRNAASRSLYQGQMSESKLVSEKQQNTDSRVQAREQEEVGYDSSSLPQTFEGLGQKFFEDIRKLAKELHDAEDVEIARHREKLAEINAQYQERLVAIRARETAQREEFLHKEFQVREHKFQQASVSNHAPNTGPGDSRGYGSMASDAGVHGERHQMYGRGQFDSYRDRPQFPGFGRGRGVESREPYPGGRAYNSGGRNF